MELDRHERTDRLLDSSSALFTSLGCGLMAIDEDFRICLAGPDVDAIIGEGAAAACLGERVSRVFGDELFGAQGMISQALRAGQRREDFGTTITVPHHPPCLATITAAPARPDASEQVFAYIVFRPISRKPDLQNGIAVFSGLVARSPVMLRLFHLIRSLDHSDASVLITGEGGTGKGLVARALHAHSPRRKGPFVTVDCHSLPAHVLEEQLFGDEQAATGDVTAPGRSHYRAAAGGTLFIDEVGNLPGSLQDKLRDLLQQRQPLAQAGSRQEARIIAATGMDLSAAVQGGRFRAELHDRLRLLALDIPPLRQRPEDILPLTDFLLARIAGRTGACARLSPEVHRALLGYGWPGNVRELENALAYAEAVRSESAIQLQDLPPVILESLRGEQVPGARPSIDRSHTTQSEQDRLLQALRRHRWRRNAAAAELGISRSTLWRKMREFGL